jgi:hypothetical protein
LSPAPTGIPTIAPHHLKMLVRNILSNGGDEFLGGEDLDVFLVAPLGYSGAIENLDGILQVDDLLFGKGVSWDIFRQRFLTVAVISGDAVSGVAN